MTLIYHAMQPVSTIKRVVIAVPPKAEFEVGFVKWYDRVKNICKQIGAKACFYAHKETLEQIHILANRNKFGVETEFCESLADGRVQCVRRFGEAVVFDLPQETERASTVRITAKKMSVFFIAASVEMFVSTIISRKRRFVNADLSADGSLRRFVLLREKISECLKFYVEKYGKVCYNHSV